MHTQTKGLPRMYHSRDFGPRPIDLLVLIVFPPVGYNKRLARGHAPLRHRGRGRGWLQRRGSQRRCRGVL